METTTKGNTNPFHQRLQDISRVVEGKSSIVASMKNTLDSENNKSSSSSAGLVFDLNDFYMKQRSEGMKSYQQKEEATKYLHRRGASATTNPPPPSTTTTTTQPTQDVDNNNNKGVVVLPQGAEVYFRSVAEAAGTEVLVENTTFNFSKTDYRAFLFVFHEDFGLLLLHCTRKRKKGPHFQIPGGHVDEAEFIAACKICVCVCVCVCVFCWRN